ncbi:MAG: NADH-quinone oxidoreductase subunit M [Solirubrobacteraceae bacterium]|nr:NADH-quinone oxidoreductase subunit M [Solirubrobacteraceae bacterium]
MLHLSILLWLPVVVGLLGLAAGRHARLVAVPGSLAILALSVAFLLDFDRDAGGLQRVTSDEWIGALGVDYSLATTGLNVWLLLLTTVGFAFAIVWSATQDRVQDDRPGAYYLLLGIGQTSVLGAFLAQDLLLFVGFFDLMLIPFFFLAIGWGDGERQQRVSAVLKMVVYTLVGSLLMLIAAVAAGVLATPQGGEISFALADIAERGVPEGSQGWIFACFAAAFLVKMPAFPIHGWVRDGYKSMSLPVLAVFSGVLSKVAAYGFIALALPLLPEGVVDLRLVVLVVAVISILYASVVAFTTTDIRLVLAYSSIAQLGFITIGALTLREDGAAGAILHSVNHGLVTLPAMLVVAILAARAGGSEDLRDMGGVAFRAPIFAALFIVVTYALLAMPGSANFAGEFYILRGAWEGVAPGFAIVASLGVVLASVYALRLFIRTTHNRVGPKVDSRELSPSELGLLAVPVLVIVALALQPDVVLRDTDRAAGAAAHAAAIADGRTGVRDEGASATTAAGGATAGGAAGAGTAAGAAGAGGIEIDPTTGLPIDPTTGMPVDPSSGMPVDPTTGAPTDDLPTDGAGR